MSGGQDSIERGFAERCARALDEDDSRLDPAVRARLAEGRRLALQELNERGERISWFNRNARSAWVLGGAGVAAAVVALFALIVGPWAPRTSMPPTAHVAPLEAEDLRLLAAEPDLSLYENLDFARWLAEHGHAG